MAFQVPPRYDRPQEAAVSARIRIDNARLTDLCRRWKIERFELFGSVLRDDFGPESDIDVLRRHPGFG